MSPGDLRSVAADTMYVLDRLLRTITAACAERPFADLIAHVWATTLVSNVELRPHSHVLGLEVIGFVLP
ncbi:hypothetical protein [Actinophytocola algeriensis]|uniref:Uncharacterized protein n=1 Tax=Actinophytocola algeriensis TaxID=1768010 RepID=A0A7W7VD28_9PSEU|nr:hypothetical protein [Actinophytocola algeriensis]MBB4905565.1 hypothetical protein [Actinophytocola algeriensis]MBE1472750.1 hypothetical protein [Actinophytocola algeriensis]